MLIRDMKWIVALKKFNAGKGEWCVPKKGTREHKVVLSIMRGATVYTNTRSEQTSWKQRAETDPAPLDRDCA